MRSFIAGVWRRLPLLTSLAIYVAPQPAVMPRGAAASTFVATVADAATNGPVADAEVTIVDLARSARTNWIGEATIADVPAGRHQVQVRRVGYAPADLDVLFDRDTVGVFFRLASSAQRLDTVKAVGKTHLNFMIDEFEARRRMGIGRFLTDSILQADSTKQLATIIERHLLGFRSLGDGRTVSRFNCGVPDVYIDGARMFSRGLRPGPDETDLRLFNGRDVAGVEFYTKTEAPVQYRRLSQACGVLLIWTRNP